MPRPHAVDQLPDDQLQFVLDHILNGETNREISFAFEDQFKTKLSKSSLARWREAAGEELADRYRLARYQAKQLLQNLEQEDADKYQVVIDSIEDRLLTATREVVSQDPFKLVLIQQEEKRRNLRERELKLKERAQSFNEEQARKAEQLQHDRFQIAANTWQFILAFVKERAASSVDVLTTLSPELLKELESYLENQST